MRSRRNAVAPVTLFSFQDIVTSVMGIMILVMLVIALELAARQLQSPTIQQAIVRQDVREALATARERIAEVQRSLASGSWNNLAAMSRSEIEQHTAELERLLPRLDNEAIRARQRLNQLSERQAESEKLLVARRSDEETLKKLKGELAALEEELARLANSSAMFFRPSQTGGKAVWLVELSGDAILAAPLGPTAPPISFAGATADSRRRQFLAWTVGRDPVREYFVLIVKPGGARLCSEIERELREKRFSVGLDLIGSEQTPIDSVRGAPILPAGKEAPNG